MHPGIPYSREEYLERVKTCSAHASLHKFKESVNSVGGSIEPVDFTRGIVVLVTGNDKTQIESIQRTTQEYGDQEKKGFSDSELCQNCVKLFKAFRDNKAKKEFMMTEKGASIVINYNIDDWTTLYPLSPCCDYCICPSSNWRCSGCC